MLCGIKRFFIFAGNKKFGKRKCSLCRKEKYSLFNYAKLVDENRSNMKIKWKKRIYGLIMAADDVFFLQGIINQPICVDSFRPNAQDIN